MDPDHYITARFDPHRPVVQVAVIGSVFGVLVFGTSVHYAFDGRALAFAMTYIVLQAGRTLVITLLTHVPEVRSDYLRAFCWYAITAVLWLLGASGHGATRAGLWAVAVLVEYGAAWRGWPVPRLGRHPLMLWARFTRYLAERYQQLLLIALGEPLLSIGIAFTQVPASPYRIMALVVAFLTTVLLWRIYFHLAGQLVAQAVAQASDPARIGRLAGAAHPIMIFGIVTTSIGHDLVEKHPARDTPLAWSMVITGGVAVFLVGRSVLEYVVYARVSASRPAGVGALLLLTAPLTRVPPLAASGVAVTILLLIAIADALRAQRRPREAPTPP